MTEASRTSDLDRAPTDAGSDIEESYQTPEEIETDLTAESTLRFGPGPSSIEAPLRLAAAIEDLIRLLPDEYSKKRAAAEERQLAALERSTNELRKVSRNKTLPKTSFAPPSIFSSPSDSDTEDFEVIEASQVKHKAEIEFRKRKWNVEGHAYIDVLDNEATPPTTRDASKEEYAFTWRTYEGRHGAIDMCEAIIYCPQLRKVLATTLRHCPWRHWDIPRMIFRGDFVSMVHNWEKLEEAAKLPDNSPCGGHLRHLLDLVKETKHVKAYFDHRARDSGTIHFKHLAYIFAPGDMVVASVANRTQAFRVSGYRYFSRWLDLYCWTYAFNGKVFSRQPFLFTFEGYRGAKQIQLLRCCPFKNHEDKNLRTTLIERGQKYRECCTRQKEKMMFNYHGNLTIFSDRPDDIFGSDANVSLQLAIFDIIVGGVRNRESGVPEDDLESSSRSEKRAKVIPYQGQVIVDVQAYNRYSPEWSKRLERSQRPEPWKECDCSKCQANDELRHQLKTYYDNVAQLDSGFWPEFEEDQLIMCSPRVFGYALAQKLWVSMDVDKLTATEEPPSGTGAPKETKWAFDKIVLPDDNKWIQTKELVKTLIQNHMNADEGKLPGVPAPLRDLVEGKGQGLVILLYGFSGVGKTLMAETVASYTGRPLLKVSVADIGLTITTVERKLGEFFDNAARWNAVLLFDEADILLEQRSDQANMKRNSLVSVFLKVLEYYEGILLLTTNRLLTFDIAVQSRIHLAVHFPNMSEDLQKRVVRMFLKDLAPDEIDTPSINVWLATDLNSEFNGRQIRNILSAAINRARSAGRQLMYEDIAVFWRRANDFKKDLADHTKLVQNRQITPDQPH